jgi:hypothetical protein
LGDTELIECPGCGGRCEPPAPLPPSSPSQPPTEQTAASPLPASSDRPRVVRCPSSDCRRSFCLHCRQPPHAQGTRCEAAEAAARVAAAAAARDAEFIDQMDREGNARCPCGVWVQKTGGCNHMKHTDCPTAVRRGLPEKRCHFCYCCFTELQPNGRNELATGALHFPRGVFEPCGHPRPVTLKPPPPAGAASLARSRRNDLIAVCAVAFGVVIASATMFFVNR